MMTKLILGNQSTGEYFVTRNGRRALIDRNNVGYFEYVMSSSEDLITQEKNTCIAYNSYSVERCGSESNYLLLGT